MPRRVGLPGAAELFRPTSAEVASTPQGDADTSAPAATASGRVRHDEKITVYVSSAELLALEQARLSLRAEHRLAVDRGRIVRAAIGLILSDFAEHGPDSALIRELNQS